MKLKRCTQCGVDKPLKMFSKEPRVKSGLEARCKDCHWQYMKKWRSENKALWFERQHKYHQTFAKKNKKP